MYPEFLVLAGVALVGVSACQCDSARKIKLEIVWQERERDSKRKLQEEGGEDLESRSGRCNICSTSKFTNIKVVHDEGS